MVADPPGRLCRLFKTYIEEEGVSLRATFIIDPEGVVKSMEMHDNSIARSTAEILRKLQASQHVYEHKGRMCPASWAPGMEALEPS
jgi:peroxiredoxin (alkyl hydroperoxide reductase subunit C)